MARIAAIAAVLALTVASSGHARAQMVRIETPQVQMPVVSTVHVSVEVSGALTQPTVFNSSLGAVSAQPAGGTYQRSSPGSTSDAPSPPSSSGATPPPSSGEGGESGDSGASTPSPEPDAPAPSAAPLIPPSPFDQAFVSRPPCYGAVWDGTASDDPNPRDDPRPKVRVLPEVAWSLGETGVSVAEALVPGGKFLEYTQLTGTLLFEAADYAMEHTDVDAKLLVLRRDGAALERLLKNAQQYPRGSVEYERAKRIYQKSLKQRISDDAAALPAGSSWHFFTHAVTDPRVRMHEVKIIGVGFLAHFVGERAAKWLRLDREVRAAAAEAYQSALDQSLTRGQWIAFNQAYSRHARRFVKAVTDDVVEEAVGSAVTEVSGVKTAVFRYVTRHCSDAVIVAYGPQQIAAAPIRSVVFAQATLARAPQVQVALPLAPIAVPLNPPAAAALSPAATEGHTALPDTPQTFTPQPVGSSSSGAESEHRSSSPRDCSQIFACRQADYVTVHPTGFDTR